MLKIEIVVGIITILTSVVTVTVYINKLYNRIENIERKESLLSEELKNFRETSRNLSKINENYTPIIKEIEKFRNELLEIKDAFSTTSIPQTVIHDKKEYQLRKCSYDFVEISCFLLVTNQTGSIDYIIINSKTKVLTAFNKEYFASLIQVDSDKKITNPDSKKSVSKLVEIAETVSVRVKFSVTDIQGRSLSLLELSTGVSGDNNIQFLDIPIIKMKKNDEK